MQLVNMARWRLYQSMLEQCYREYCPDAIGRVLSIKLTETFRRRLIRAVIFR